MLPGWYGVGRAIEAFADKGLLAEMAEGWPLFAATLANMEMVLAKSDMAIAARYAGLVEDAGLRDAVFGRIRDGWHLTRDGLLAATGQARLLAKHPALDASIRLRLPYIEPLNLLQIELLKAPPRGRGGCAHRRGDFAVDQRDRDGVAEFGIALPAASPAKAGAQLRAAEWYGKPSPTETVATGPRPSPGWHKRYTLPVLPRKREPRVSDDAGAARGPAAFAGNSSYSTQSSPRSR